MRVRVLRLQVEEERADAERDGERQARRDVALARAFAERADRERRRDRERDQPPERIDPDEERARAAGEPDIRDRVPGERERSEHDEISDRGRKRGDDGARDECDLHVRICEERIHAESPATTMIRPRTRNTSTGRS